MNASATDMQASTPMGAYSDAPAAGQEQSDEERQQALARRQGRLDAVAVNLEGWLADAISWREDAEHEWMTALQQYETGKSDGTESATKDRQASNVADYQRTGDNITRPAVLLLTSRVADMLFPTSDRNWDITPSPDAKIDLDALGVSMVDEEGNALPEAAIEAEEQRIAEERCESMRTQIDDQLQESNYSGAGREAIFDGHLYGTGVIRGPFPRTKLCRKPDPETGKWSRSYEETPTATISYVDLFQFYPRPCRSIDECPGVYILHLMTKSKLRALADEPGFSRTQVARALKGEAKYSGLARSPLYMRAGGSGRGVTLTLDDRYAVWEYSGEMGKDGVIDFTQGLLDEASITEDVASAIIAKLSDDDLISVNCEVWSVNGIVIKMVLRPVDDNMPLYHVYNYEKNPDTVFGKGLPYVLREDQLAAQQLWQAMMLNAMMSAGLQIAVKKGALEPGKGQTYDMTFTRPRVWEFTDDAVDVRTAFQAWQVPNVIAEIMPMYERAKANGNEHALLPAITQGDATNAVPTSSGLSMLMNAANVVTRQLAKGWDDNITTPLINGMYDWNLERGREDAKGDYTVIPRGVSHLLVKDVQAQRYLFALQTYAANPEMASRMNWGEWARMGMVVMELDSGKLLKDEATVKAEQEAAAQNPPQDPRMQAETNRAKQIENEFLIAQEELKQRQSEFAAKNETDKWEAASRERVAQLNYQASLAGLDASEREAMAKIDADLQKDSMWGRIKIEEVAAKARNDQFEAKVEADTAPGPRLA